MKAVHVMNAPMKHGDEKGGYNNDMESFNCNLMEMYLDPAMKGLLGQPVVVPRKPREPLNPIVARSQAPVEKPSLPWRPMPMFKPGGFETPLCRVMDYLGFTCSGLAKMIGCHPSCINRCRSGKTRPYLVDARAIVAILNRELDETLQVTVDSLWPEGGLKKDRSYGRK